MDQQLEMDQQLCSGNSPDNRATQLARHQQLCSGDSPDNRAMQLARRRERARNRRASGDLGTAVAVDSVLLQRLPKREGNAPVPTSSSG